MATADGLTDAQRKEVADMIASALQDAKVKSSAGLKIENAAHKTGKALEKFRIAITTKK